MSSRQSSAMEAGLWGSCRPHRLRGHTDGTLAMATSDEDSPKLSSPAREPETNPETKQPQNVLDEEETEEEDEGEQGDGAKPKPEPKFPELSHPEWVEERFRIDRKKLETMLHGPPDENGQTGEEFFEKVMMETSTQIKWPSKLKIGAKSKKDPYVKVEGKKCNVMEAKKMILDLLETKVNKVTLKMDVSHTEHSHVIGKGGGNIKKVMEVTACHIHFPDSNRHNVTGEKSNQVSIAGSVDSVESARRRIRDLQPLVLTFDLPVALVPSISLDATSPVIQHVAQAFGVSISFRQQAKVYSSSSCVVRGMQDNCTSVKKATGVLMELIFGAEGGGVVSTQMDITSQQHLFLLGPSGASFLSVMHLTQTQIILPDLNAPQSPSALLIRGGVEGVCLARQQLLDCLPVCLMFDMREDGEVDPRKLSQMMQNLGVFISVKPKVKQTTKSVVVKSLERSVKNLYEARRLLLGLQSTEVTTTVKPTCHLPSAGNTLSNYWLNLMMQQLGLSDPGVVITPEAALSAILQVKPRPSAPPGLSMNQEEGRTAQRAMDSMLEKMPEVKDQLSSLFLGTPVPGAHASNVKSGNPERRNSQSEAIREWDPEENATLSRRESAKTTSQQFLSDVLDLGCNERRNSLRRDVIPTGSDSTGSEDCDYEKKKLLATRAMQKKPVVTEVRTPTDTWSGLGFSKSMPAEAVKELRCVSRRNYKSYLGNSHLQLQARSSQNNRDRISNGSDSENWRERRGSSPYSSSSSSSTSTASFISSSSSSSLSAFVPSSNRSLMDKGSDSYLASSNYFEDVSPTCSSTLQHDQNLPELFSQLGLTKYYDIFQQQEIDFQTFLTLSDEDLKEVGVSTFGARRKMLLAISDLNKGNKNPLDLPTVKPGYLEGGASGRLPRIMDMNVGTKSSRW